MPVITFHVDGDPKPMPKKQAFARMLPNGKPFARVFDAKTADGWKSLIADAVREQRPKEPLDQAMLVRVRFLFRRPKNLCRRKDPDGEIPHTGKADVDNLTKSVFDTLTQIGFWRDDGQVYSLYVEKFYTAKNGRPGMDVKLSWTSAEDAELWRKVQQGG